MKLLTTKEMRKVKMTQLRPVSKTEKIIFPVLVTIFVILLVPDTAPLIGMLMLATCSGSAACATACPIPRRTR